MHAVLTPYVPELDRPITAHARQLRLLHRIERDLLDAGGVAAQLGGVFDVGPLWVPDSEGAVLRACCDEAALGVPVEGADAVFEVSLRNRGRRMRGKIKEPYT